MGRIARAEGQPAVVAPFRAPGAETLRRRLREADLPESGMEQLTDGRGGEPLSRPSTVGFVYWGRTWHDARLKLMVHVTVDPSSDSPRPPGQKQGDMEYVSMLEARAFENILETFNTRAVTRADAPTLSARVAAGPIPPADPPTPAFATLQRHLAAAGVATNLEKGKLTFRSARPAGAVSDARPEPLPGRNRFEGGRDCPSRV